MLFSPLIIFIFFLFRNSHSSSEYYKLHTIRINDFAMQYLDIMQFHYKKTLLVGCRSLEQYWKQ